MKRQLYYPAATGKQVLWLSNYASKLTGHAPALGVSADDCAASIADARWLIYVLGTWYPAVKMWHKSCGEALALAQSPDSLAAMVLPVFEAPPLPAPTPGGLPAVVPVAEGALDRIFSLIQVIKEADGYDAAIGQDLGAVGAEATPPDFAVLKPELRLSLVATGVLIKWGWLGFRGVTA